MPRLPPTTFITQHYKLKRIWDEYQDLFSWISPADQQLLHRFYRPSETLTDDELIKHRREITLRNKSIANKAGKVYAKLARGEMYEPPAIATSNGRTVQVRSILRPQPDIELIVKAAIRLAEAEAEAAKAEYLKEHLPKRDPPD